MTYSDNGKLFGLLKLSYSGNGKFLSLPKVNDVL